MPGSVPAAVELTAVQLAGHVVGRRRAVPRLIAVPAVEAAPRIGSVIAVAVRHTAPPPGGVKAGAAPAGDRDDVRFPPRRRRARRGIGGCRSSESDPADKADDCRAHFRCLIEIEASRHQQSMRGGNSIAARASLVPISPRVFGSPPQRGGGEPCEAWWRGCGRAPGSPQKILGTEWARWGCSLRLASLATSPALQGRSLTRPPSLPDWGGRRSAQVFIAS